ncbi:MAG: ribosome-associated translation inhibitor RaiA [Anaerolineae bacterium]|nr:ribosome-associated translation inhibitor RaiA [Anaerolineae bacterium]
MQFTVQGKGIDVTEHLHDYVEKKLGRLDRYLSTISEVRIELSTEKTRSSEDRYVTQVTVRTDRTILRAEERTGDIFTSIDMVMDKIKRQIDRYKDKRRSRSRSAAAAMDVEPVELPVALEEEEEQGRIVRVKRFSVTPMTPEEAVEQMELLGHDFFVFYNMNEGEINVLYSRRDGNYGLLQPEMG